MPVEKINNSDTLRVGKDKINEVIDLGNQIVVDSANATSTANGAVDIANGAVTTANTAKTTADATATQLETVIIESGTSDAEVLAARTDGNTAETFPTVGGRLDSVTSQVVQAEEDLKQRTLNVRQPPFNLKADGTDETTALQAVADYVKNYGSPLEITFPAGTYLYTQSPNWGIPDVTILGVGKPIFKYTGTDKAFIVDASPDLIRRYYENITIKDIIIEGNANCLNGMFRRNISRSLFENIEVREINSTSGKAFNLTWGVSNIHRKLVHSINSHYTLNMGYDGIFISNTDVGGDKSTNETFYDSCIEGSSIGARVFVGDNINFIGGTLEACKIYGAVFGAETRGCSLYGIAMEANGTADVSDGGKLNKFINSYTQKDFLIGATSEQCKIDGGFHQKITIASAAKNPVVEDIYVSQYAVGGGIIHNNNLTARIRNVIDRQSGVILYGQTAMSPVKSRTGITVGASPFQYDNTTQFPKLVNISAGTITQILWGNGGDVFELYGSTTKGQSNGQFLLMPGDYLKVSYSVAPAMNFIPR